MNTKAFIQLKTTMGFSLIDGLISIAVITILATFAYPAYFAFISRSWQIEAKELIAKIMNAQAGFRLSCPYYAGTLEQSTSPSVCNGGGTQSGGQTILRVPFSLETPHYTSKINFANEKSYQIEVNFKGEGNSTICKRIVANFSDGSLTYPEQVGETCLKRK
jgi:type II secretory pathway pseudopilin PulG